ncbi:hypothetical protein [Nocardioides antri]|uniref:Uncharacterized protein n=1 Tax=Nocardioides antri TaxID=2607659 RepID=A0A5B1M614_9ACTN|nr:hypothetical protein [Nocardioides antri]KAA1427918.1 hypothetical protein F0U47_10935 [Nocardioides antri]
MSTVGTITKLATGVVGKAAHAVIHPRQTVTAVTGHARDLAASVTGGDQKAPSTTDDAAAATEVPLYESPQRNVEPAEPVEPAQSVEPSTTEPKAASRESAHHGRGSDPTDDWHDELDDAPDVGINPATGLPNTYQASEDGPLLDPSVAKAVRSESETMSRAADPDKDPHEDEEQ